MKVCTACKIEKPIESFYAHKGAKDGRTCQCKECGKKRLLKWRRDNPERFARIKSRWLENNPEKRREVCAKYRAKNKERIKQNTRRSLLSRKYGLTVEDLEKRISEQNNKCPICLDALGKSPHVDHCHTTGEVRGVLCHLCNVGLGSFRDSPEALNRAAQYLRRASNPVDESFCGDAGC